jgi:ribulose 1,5-bisphosphate synthetase/thiazole synthase
VEIMDKEINEFSGNRRSFLRNFALVSSSALLSTNSVAADNSPPTQENKSTNTFELKRTIPVVNGYDLVVAGGGPAGVAAAISAARLGAKVVLIEAVGCLGGMGSAGGVAAFDPMANGKMQLVQGFMGEVVEEMHKAGFMAVDPENWRLKYHAWSQFNPEGLKLTLDRMAQKAGVKVHFFTRVMEADVDHERKVVKGVIINNIEGLKYIKASTFIDCTGDAVLANLCGVECWEAGKDTEKIMPPTLTTLWSGQHELTSHEFRKLYFDSVAKGMHKHPTKKLVGLSKVDESLYYLNGGHIFDMNALNNDSLSEGIMRGREIADDFRKMLKDHPKAKLSLAATGQLIGVRESRRIKGEYVYNKTDMETRKVFNDAIGVYCKACDIHPYANTDAAMKEHYEIYYKSELYRPKIGEMFYMPYGMLVPKGWKNLWTAGRCASADILAQGSLRCQPYCSQMGQAAGTAAVQAMQFGETADNLNTERLVKALREQNVFLPQEKLSPEMTR